MDRAGSRPDPGTASHGRTFTLSPPGRNPLTGSLDLAPVPVGIRTRETVTRTARRVIRL
ncbi:hypothetical protein GCM10010417_39780 [Streptomyces carpaticus]